MNKYFYFSLIFALLACEEEINNEVSTNCNNSSEPIIGTCHIIFMMNIIIQMIMNGLERVMYNVVLYLTQI